MLPSYQLAKFKFEHVKIFPIHPSPVHFFSFKLLLIPCKIYRPYPKRNHPSRPKPGPIPPGAANSPSSLSPFVTLQCHSEKFLHWFPHGPDASLHKMLLAYTNTGKDNMLIPTLKCYQLAKFKFKHVKKFWKKSCMFTTHMSTTPKKVSSKFKIETKKDKFRCE